MQLANTTNYLHNPHTSSHPEVGLQQTETPPPSFVHSSTVPDSSLPSSISTPATLLPHADNQIHNSNSSTPQPHNNHPSAALPTSPASGVVSILPSSSSTLPPTLLIAVNDSNSHSSTPIHATAGSYAASPANTLNVSVTTPVAISSASSSPPAQLSPQPSPSPSASGLTAKERLAARLASSRSGSVAISRRVYDEAIRAGYSPDQAQSKADEAVAAAAAGQPFPTITPVRALSHDAADSDILPNKTSLPLRQTVSAHNLGSDTFATSASAFPNSYAPSAASSSSSATLTAAPSPTSALRPPISPMQQLPNAVPSSIQASTRIASSSGVLPSRSAAEWAIRDAQFMNDICYGVASAQGDRYSMEDEHTVVQQFDRLIRQCNPVSPKPAIRTVTSPPSTSSDGIVSPFAPSSNHPHQGLQSFFGIYDGHGGRESAQFVRDKLHVNIAKRMLNPKIGVSGTVDIGDAMKLGAADTEIALLQAMREKKNSSGAVVAFTVLSGMQMYVAHAGDSRAVLCREGVAMDLTQDHKPGLEDEQSRILALGGSISDGRVNGEISVSRALGDYDVDSGKKMLGLSAEVALSKFYLTDEDEFVILACDGLWDVMNSEVAVKFARSQLRQHNDIQRCANELVQQALRQNSTDNVSVIVIGFPHPQPDSEPLIVPPDKKPGARANRVPVPPRPERLHLNEAGRNNLMQVLELKEEDIRKHQQQYE